MLEPATAGPPSPGSLRVRRASRLRRVGTEVAGPGGSAHDIDFRAPRPLRAAARLLALLLLPAVLWMSGALPERAALGFAVSVFALAFLQGSLGVYDRRRCRRFGDALLRAHPGRAPVSGPAAWRSHELTSARNRRELARGMRQLRRQTETCLSLGSRRVDRALLEAILPLVRQLESRLDRISEPVTPVGMLDIEALATNELGPLSCPERAGDLHTALAQALAALEPER